MPLRFSWRGVNEDPCGSGQPSAVEEPNQEEAGVQSRGNVQRAGRQRGRHRQRQRLLQPQTQPGCRRDAANGGERSGSTGTFAASQAQRLTCGLRTKTLLPTGTEMIEYK